MASPGGDHPAGGVNVHLDVPLGILAVQIEELGNDHIGDLVIHGGAQKDDPFPQEQ